MSLTSLRASSLRLVASFFILLAFIYGLKHPLAQPLVDTICLVLAKLTALIIQLFMPGVVLSNNIIYLGSVEYGIEVAPECTGLLGCVALAAFVVVEKAPVVEKVKALTVGFFIIQVLNIARLCILFGARVFLLPPTYNAIHEFYVLVVMIILFISLYKYWLSKLSTTAIQSSNSSQHTQRLTSSNINIEIAKFSVVSAALIFIYSVSIQPQMKYLVYLPTSALINATDANWGSKVSLDSEQNGLVVSNTIFGSRTPIAEEGDTRSIELNQPTTVELSLNKNNFVLPLLLTLLFVCRRLSVKSGLAILAICILMESCWIVISYYHVVERAILATPFPATIVGDGSIERVHKSTYTYVEFMKHLKATLLSFMTYTVCAFLWRSKRDGLNDIPYSKEREPAKSRQITGLKFQQ